ncbi:MAG: hypothetical protein PWR24_1490 [Desulfonauticus sp.]|nr:hypothetical protein [Desulfonauticus sp.]
MDKKIVAETIITCHANADFDAIASMVAAKKLYPEGVLIFPGSQEKNIKDFFLESTSYLYNFKHSNDVDIEKVKKVILVDTKQYSRVPHIHKILKNKNISIHIYDHHPDTEDDLSADKIIYKKWGSTTTIIIDILKKQNMDITPDEATLLGLGIYEDTGSFTFNSTTEHDFLAAAWLKSKGMDLNVIAEFINRDFTSSQIEILNTLIKNSFTKNINSIDITITYISLDEYLGDFAFIVHKFMEIENLKVVFAIARMNDRIHLVARSRIPEVNVGKVCSYFGGGGHTYAASASIKDRTLNQVKEELLAILFSIINSELKVKKLMTSPAIVIENRKNLRQAAELMTKLGLKAIPVVNEKNECIGILEHQIAEKAILHGLGELNLEDYMQKDISCVDKETSLYTVIDIILRQRQRLVPVVDKNKEVVGVFTRTDLINFLVQEPLKLPENLLNNHPKEKNIQRLLKEKLDKKSLELVMLAGKVAKQLNFQVYLVGGVVRDLLLNVPVKDLDFVVEGDGIAFAQHFAQIIGGRVRSHKKFKTAVIILNNEQKIDVATARLEYYEYPAALPIVELSSLKMDLFRRDFTINTLAIHLNPENFGKLIDFFGGQRDLKEKTIRVIHSLSFVEDPTRILRAIRFEQRFNFRIGKQTEKLIKSALKIKIFDKLSGTRILHELKLIFQEEKVVQCLKRLKELEILTAIHPKLDLNLKNIKIIEEIEKVLHWYTLLYLKEKVRKDILYLLALLSDLNYEDCKLVINRLKLSKKETRVFFEIREKSKNSYINIIRSREKFLKLSEIYFLLEDIPLEGIIYLLAILKDEKIRENISLYISQYRKLKLFISGKDLINLGLKPGPKFNFIFQKIKKAFLEGKAKDRESQLKLAKEIIATWK